MFSYRILIQIQKSIDDIEVEEEDDDVVEETQIENNITRIQREEDRIMTKEFDHTSSFQEPLREQEGEVSSNFNAYNFWKPSLPDIDLELEGIGEDDDEDDEEEEERDQTKEIKENGNTHLQNKKTIDQV